MLKGFKEFIIKGNVVDLAVGIIIGVAFGNVVNALVKDIISPLIAAIGGTPDFSSFYFTINNSKFMFGNFLNTVISFLINATVVYFFIVLPSNKLKALTKRDLPLEPTNKKCPMCFSEINLAAKRCPFCTSVLKNNIK